MTASEEIYMELKYITYFSDGSFKLSGDTGGYPQFTGTIPAPDLNCSNEEERISRHNEGCDDINTQGFMITSRKRIKNIPFDKPGQKTTLKIKFRPCKSEYEMKILSETIIGIFCRRGHT